MAVWCIGHTLYIDYLTMNMNIRKLCNSYLNEKSQTCPNVIVFCQCLSVCLHMLFIYSWSIVSNSYASDFRNNSLYKQVNSLFTYLVDTLSWSNFDFKYPNSNSIGFNQGEYYALKITFALKALQVSNTLECVWITALSIRITISL